VRLGLYRPNGRLYVLGAGQLGLCLGDKSRSCYLVYVLDAIEVSRKVK
jgi:hypothetical protein